MSFSKGKSGNPNGRPKGSKSTFTIESFKRAVQKVEEMDKVNVLEHFVRRALLSDKVLVVLINKLIPNMNDPKNEFDEGLLNSKIEFSFYKDLTPEKMKELGKYLVQ